MKLTEQNRKWWILFAMTATVSMIFVDITVLPVVLPTLQREMGISDLGLQWIINAYTLVLACLVLAGGKFGDRWGLKKTFCLGVTLFAVASALCGLSHSGGWIIAARALQGLGGALLMPATQGIIISHFPPHQRGKALGLYVSVGAIFLALGPLIGGTLTSYLSWRYVFWINLPIAAVGLLLALYSVPPMQGKEEKFDFRGFGILSLGIASLIIALMQSQNWGWTSPITLFLMATGVFLLFFLFLRKHKPHASILDFELMKKTSFIASASAIFCTQLITMAPVFWAIYFQNILGFTPSEAGGFAFMANFPILIAAPLGGYLVDKFGPRLPVVSGFILIFFSLCWFVAFLHESSIWILTPTLFSFGFGACMIYTPSFVSMMNEVPSDRRGSASGLTATLRQFSSSFGLALFGSLYSSIYLSRLGQYLRAEAATESLSAHDFEGLLSREPSAMSNLHQLSTSSATYVMEAARTSFLDAFSRINLTAAVVAFIGIFIGWCLMANRPIHVSK